MFGATGSLESWMSFLTVNSVLAGAVFVVVLVATRLVPRGAPAFRVALWSLVLIRLVLPPGFGHPFAAGALVERVFRFDAHSMPPAYPAGDEASAVPRVHATVIGSAVGAAVDPWRSVGILWLAGFVVVATLQLRRRHVVLRVLSDARRVRDPEVEAASARWRALLGVRRSVRVVTSTGGLAPFTIGVVRPVIHLPAAVSGDPLCMEAAIAHEMAHVARFDALWLGLQNLLQAVYFFNPVVWITRGLISQAREQLCDATVVAADRLAAKDYVGGLLDVLRLELREVEAPTMTARTRRIGVRILNIFEREGRPGPRIGEALVLASVLGLFLLPLGPPGADASQGPVAEAAAQTLPERATTEPLTFVNPVAKGRVTWGWGPGHLDPFTHEEVSHRGIDLAAPSGTPVVSPADGVVRVATESFEASAAAGTVILIDHGDGLSTFFAHLDSLEVVEGQKIERGAVIATVGSTGKSTGPHLHFEVRRNGEAVNPADFVGDWK